MTEALNGAVTLLKRLKASLEHQRRFGDDTLGRYRQVATQAEGDIEEWLIDNGYQASAERPEPAERISDG